VEPENFFERVRCYDWSLSIVAHAPVNDYLIRSRQLRVLIFSIGYRGVVAQIDVNWKILRETFAERSVCDG
jgi:hypothetical protein